MRLKAGFTIEAAVIFTFITTLVVSIIKLDYYLHDQVVNDYVKVAGAMKYTEASNFYYDISSEKISIKSIVNSPVVGDDDAFVKKQLNQINKQVEEYYTNAILNDENKMSSTSIDSIITVTGNGNMIRSSGRVVQLIGEVTK